MVEGEKEEVGDRTDPEKWFLPLTFRNYPGIYVYTEHLGRIHPDWLFTKQ